MYSMATTTSLVIVWVAVIIGCHGHGRLIEPPSRASAWRYGFNTPPDYNDNEGFCGGFSHQYQTQDGKCGICGDPWDQVPRDHEVGGIYATGTIVRQYFEGQVLNLTAQITANHRGNFEARICPDPQIEADQECLDMYRLSLADGSGNIHNISREVGLHTMLLQLPQGLTCQHCVLQWRYVTGNNWGLCPDGSGALGCGPQEEFRACADITISSTKNTRSEFLEVFGREIEEKKVVPSNLNKGLVEKVPLHCKGTGDWTALPGANKWCTINCNNYPAICPSTRCQCD